MTEPWPLEGDELPPRTVRSDVEQVMRYCALTWVFPRFIYDPSVQFAGIAGVVVPGPVRLMFMEWVLEDWLAERGWVRQLRAAHRHPDIVETDVTITGRVARVYAEDGARRADIEIAFTNERGITTVRGFATVELST